MRNDENQFDLIMFGAKTVGSSDNIKSEKMTSSKPKTLNSFRRKYQRRDLSVWCFAGRRLYRFISLAVISLIAISLLLLQASSITDWASDKILANAVVPDDKELVPGIISP